MGSYRVHNWPLLLHGAAPAPRRQAVAIDRGRTHHFREFAGPGAATVDLKQPVGGGDIALGEEEIFYCLRVNVRTPQRSRRISTDWRNRDHYRFRRAEQAQKEANRYDSHLFTVGFLLSDLQPDFDGVEGVEEDSDLLDFRIFGYPIAGRLGCRLTVGFSPLLSPCELSDLGLGSLLLPLP
jgi:hypothetical protein